MLEVLKRRSNFVLISLADALRLHRSALYAVTNGRMAQICNWNTRPCQVKLFNHKTDMDPRSRKTETVRA